MLYTHPMMYFWPIWGDSSKHSHQSAATAAPPLCQPPVKVFVHLVVSPRSSRPSCCHPCAPQPASAASIRTAQSTGCAGRGTTLRWGRAGTRPDGGSCWPSSGPSSCRTRTTSCRWGSGSWHRSGTLSSTSCRSATCRQPRTQQLRQRRQGFNKLEGGWFFWGAAANLIRSHFILPGVSFQQLNFWRAFGKRKACDGTCMYWKAASYGSENQSCSEQGDIAVYSFAKSFCMFEWIFSPCMIS